MLYPARWKEITVDQSKILKQIDCSVFFWGGGGGPPTNDKLMANPENDSPSEITHKI